MQLRVAELFAGVGGFRIGLEGSGHTVVWSNQWEPGKKSQHASDCYTRHFGNKGHANVDIAKVDAAMIPVHDLLVAGFPCQDYSVATTKAEGINGKKGVLWWEINRILENHRPSLVLLENVDRLLKSPTDQRGRDFGILLWCLQRLGYVVEWRVVNAADYGGAQRRRRVFLLAQRWTQEILDAVSDAPATWTTQDGVLARAFPVRSTVLPNIPSKPHTRLPRGLQETSDKFAFAFEDGGVLAGRDVWTFRLEPKMPRPQQLRSVLQQDAAVQYYIPPEQMAAWKYLKGAKSEPRKARNGFEYNYTEGALPFPDPLDRPSRTILTSEGGAGPSRFKHVVEDPQTGNLRRLTPVEVERLNGFPSDWTAGMPEGWRYFCMGNALVVGLVERLAAVFSTLPESHHLVAAGT